MHYGLLVNIKGNESESNAKASPNNEDNVWPVAQPHGYPKNPPPPPQEILANRAEYDENLRYRKYWPPEGCSDTPLVCLYRLYEFLVVDDVTGYRNTIEYFCK
ncbi:MAG: hypothetical protein Q9209_006398 [Squamulea sp. 1 TL-2023]